MDPAADPPTWLAAANGEHTLNLEWPTGFSMRVTDGVAEVVDPEGSVVVRDGGQLDGAFGDASAHGGGWFAICGIGSRSYAVSPHP